MIKEYSLTLLKELDKQLEAVHFETDKPIEYSERAIQIVIKALEHLKTYFLKYKFQSKDEEIHFFKKIKPQFTYKLIYYNEIYNIETTRPSGSEKMVRKFFNGELEKLKTFFNDNLDFYRYYRTGNTALDKKYFIRGQHDIKLTLDSFYFQADHRFTTSHDFRVAKIMANDLVQLYLENEQSKIQKKDDQKKRPARVTQQRWTGSKVSLIELIYALHAEGVFNEGKSDLKDVADFFEAALEMDLGQYHRAFLEIRARKSDRTKFLNSLREKLVSRMDDADEGI